MKKFFVFLLIVVVGILPCQVVASDFVVDGISYNITSAGKHTVAVTSGTNGYVGSVVIPETIAYKGVTYSVTTIGERAFGTCIGLTSITIPNSVTTIGESAFSSCLLLTSVTIGNSVTTIGDEAFSGCSGLTSIIIPNNVTTIGIMAFSGCCGLESIVVDAGNPVYDSRDNCNAIIETSSNKLVQGCKNTIIPDEVTAIGAGAFSGCSGLTSIAIGNSVTTIGDLAFHGCDSLKDFYCHAESVPTAGYDIFFFVNLSSATLHIPEASLQKYGSREPWNRFGQIVALTENDGIEQ